MDLLGRKLRRDGFGVDGVDGVEIYGFLMERFGGDCCGLIGLGRVNGVDGDGERRDWIKKKIIL